MGKTIKQIADEIGVSKTAIRKKMKVLFNDDTGNQFAETVSGVVYISVSGETLIKSAFSKDTGNQLPETDSGKVSGEVSGWFAVVDTLKLQLEMLQNQLVEKDRQIEKKDIQIERLQAALDTQQHLQAGVQQTVLQLTEGKKGLLKRFFERDKG